MLQQLVYRKFLVFGIGMFSTAFGAIVINSLVVSAESTYEKWGFVISRPPIQEVVTEIDIVTNASIIEMVTVEEKQIQFNNASETLQEKPSHFKVATETIEEVLDYRDYYPYTTTYERVIDYLHDTEALKVPIEQVAEDTIMELYPLLAETCKLEVGTQEPWEQFYDSRWLLAGVVLEGTTADDTKVLVVGLRGGEVQNDHYPYYEFAFVFEDDEYKLESFQRWYFDIAGEEQGEIFYYLGFTIVEWPLAFMRVAFAPLLSLFAAAAAVVGSIGIATRRRRNATLAS